jgi:hypothetical protein
VGTLGRWVEAVNGSGGVLALAPGEEPKLPPGLYFEQGVTRDHRCNSPPWSREMDASFWYTWAGHPPSCALEAFNLTDFCAVLGGRDIVIVGDSISFTYHESLLSTFFPKQGTSGMPELQHGQMEECPAHPVCMAEALATQHLPPGHPSKCAPATVRYVRNDFLTVNAWFDPAAQVFFNDGHLDPNLTQRRGRLLYSRPWAPFVSNNSLLFLNRGAHYRVDEVVLKTLGETFTQVRRKFPGALTVFRNTPPGHVHHGNKLLPSAQRAHFDEGGPGDFYNWTQFLIQNKKVQALVDRLSAKLGGRLLYLDVDNSTSLRPDHHRDGLHYCVPGPQDHWTHMLYSVLRKARQLQLV